MNDEHKHEHKHENEHEHEYERYICSLPMQFTVQVLASKRM